MGNIKNLVGMKFGRWLVIKRGENGGHGKARWQCLCECGNERLVYGNSLKHGHSQSCGCLQKELIAKRRITHGYTINEKKPKVYKVWVGMFQRCNNPKNPAYNHYGGHGISVCDRWNDFKNFLEDMGERPRGLTLEREDNDGNYEPGNCRWATLKQQQENSRKPKLNKLKVQVIKKLLAESSLTLKDIADIFNVSVSHISHIKSNKTWKNVLYKPV